MKYKFKFTGYQNHPQKRMFRFFNNYFKNEDNTAFFMAAVIEAVFNAARYSIKTFDTAEIEISVRYINKALIVSISSDTYSVAAVDIQRKMMELAKNEEHWSSLVDGTSDRGIWIMLQACDRVILEPKMEKVHLVVYFPYRVKELSNKALLKKMDIGVLEI